MLVNVDSKSHKITEGNMGNPDRWTFDVAAAHLYYLMTSDSYSRSSIIYSQGNRRGGRKGAWVPRIVGTMKTNPFSTNAQSKFVSVVLDVILGLAGHT